MPALQKGVHRLRSPSKTYGYCKLAIQLETVSSGMRLPTVWFLGSMLLCVYPSLGARGFSQTFQASLCSAGRTDGMRYDCASRPRPVLGVRLSFFRVLCLRLLTSCLQCQSRGFEGLFLVYSQVMGIMEAAIRSDVKIRRAHSCTDTRRSECGLVISCGYI
ncbi:unnamed protein product [Arctogadus glacialis]